MLKTVLFIAICIGICITSFFSFGMIQEYRDVVARIESPADIRTVFEDVSLSPTAVSSNIRDTDEIFKIVYENPGQYKYIHFPLYISGREIKKSKTKATRFLGKMSSGTVLHNEIPVHLVFEKNELFCKITNQDYELIHKSEGVVLLSGSGEFNPLVEDFGNEDSDNVVLSSKRRKFDFDTKEVDIDHNIITEVMVSNDKIKIESTNSWIQFFTMPRVVGIGVIATATVFLFFKWNCIKNLLRH